jgi:hypothetical protein
LLIPEFFKMPEGDKFCGGALSPEKYERLTGELPKCKSNWTRKNAK